MDYASLAKRIKEWGVELGFQAVGVADIGVCNADRLKAQLPSPALDASGKRFVIHGA